jgi:hypothetical protein
MENFNVLIIFVTFQVVMFIAISENIFDVKLRLVVVMM